MVFFVTGRSAWTYIDTPVLSAFNCSFADTGTSWNRGWYVGGGFEYAVTNYLNVGIQYTHIDAKRHGGPATPIAGDDRKVGDHIDMVMVRASIPFFRFNNNLQRTQH
ncbi:MAG: hypothetical protein WBG10_01080 [Pseudolabrys sp.]